MRTVLSWSIGLWILGTVTAWASDGSDLQSMVLGNNSSRFVFGTMLDEENGSQQFMLDTSTGRLWKMEEDIDGRMVLSSVPYLGMSDGKRLSVPDNIKDEVVNQLKQSRSRSVELEGELVPTRQGPEEEASSTPRSREPTGSSTN